VRRRRFHGHRHHCLSHGRLPPGDPGTVTGQARDATRDVPEGGLGVAGADPPVSRLRDGVLRISGRYVPDAFPASRVGEWDWVSEERLTTYAYDSMASHEARREGRELHPKSNAFRQALPVREEVDRVGAHGVEIRERAYRFGVGESYL
jgi:hypothetical protein